MSYFLQASLGSHFSCPITLFSFIALQHYLVGLFQMCKFSGEKWKTSSDLHICERSWQSLYPDYLLANLNLNEFRHLRCDMKIHVNISKEQSSFVSLSILHVVIINWISSSSFDSDIFIVKLWWKAILMLMNNGSVDNNLCQTWVAESTFING